jgi:hypothetical protein
MNVDLVIAGMMTTGVAVVGWVVRQVAARIAATITLAEHTATRMSEHEKLCGERYASIEQGYQHLAETHATFVAVSDRRHQEHVDRANRIDSKLDVIIGKL